MNLFMPDEGNPASVGGAGTVPFNSRPTSSASRSADHGGPNGMGTEGQAIGVITMLSIEEESFPVHDRTVDEPTDEYLK